jgi:CRP-like cAMP-binding protein
VIEAHLLLLRQRNEVSSEEERAIRDAIGESRDAPADTVVIRAGEELTVSTLLLEGIMCRYKDLRDGQRQISALHVPGDFVDLHSFTLKRLDHNIMALTRCRFAPMPHQKLVEITEAFPHLTRTYWFLTTRDGAIHREWMLSLGRRTALQRLAHLFCELFVRFETVGLTEGGNFPLGITQTDLAECTGLTAVHVNRTLRELRERELLEISGRRAIIRDMPGLQSLAEFNSAYLYTEPTVG